MRFSFFGSHDFRLLIGIVLVAHCLPTHAQSLSDRVQRRNGIDSGTITGTTPLGITITKGGVASKIPAEEIRSVQFAEEPGEFRSIRAALGRERFDTAWETLQKIDPSTVTRPEIQQELDFLLAHCEGNLALAGQSDRQQAIEGLGDFVAKHRTSFHIPEALELQGDLYRAVGDETAARKKYETLAKAPAAFYKSRSALLVGQLLREQGEPEAALEQFEAALKLAAADAASEDQRLVANFGRAACLSAMDKLVEGTALVGQVLQQSKPEDIGAIARAYNALGDCYLAAGDLRGARNAYLHVDLMYQVAGAEHAQALYRLIKVWKELRQPTRAQDAQQRLGDEYPLSRWAGR